MRKVLRYENNEAYWNRRWAEAEHDQDRFTDVTIYPIRYAEMVMTDRSLRSLELGAGLGRLLKQYHFSGHHICGLERSAVAVERLKAEHPALDIREGDVRQLPYADAEFDVILAFGLYHNLENGLEEALAETARCLKPGGRFCISMRPDNIEMSWNERYWLWRNRHRRGQPRVFHKWLVSAAEFTRLIAPFGLRVEQVHYARNVSLLYRVPFLRARAADESERRAAGYRLNAVGRTLDRVLTRYFVTHFSNVVVFIGQKVAV